MEIFIAWVAFSVVVGVGANTRGRNGLGWFLLAMITSPLLAGLLLLALPRIDPVVGSKAPAPWEKDVRVKVDQGSQVSSLPSKQDSRFQADGVYSGIPYRVAADGSVEGVMSAGIVHFKNMDHFIAAATGRNS